MSSALKDHTGKVSVMRLTLFLVITCVLAAWLWECYHAKAMVDPNPEVIKALAALLGVKLYQNYQETHKPERPHSIDLNPPRR